MAEHETIHEFVESAIAEYLIGSKLALEFRKGQEWHPQDVGGCLGVTSAVLLFCVLDAIGSFCRREASFVVTIEGRNRSIQAEGYQHFFVLNASDLYAQNLSENEIKSLYDRYRSLLAHNAVIAPGGGLVTDETILDAFPRIAGAMVVNLSAFHRLSCAAAQRFFSTHVVEDCHAVQIIRARASMPSVEGG